MQGMESTAALLCLSAASHTGHSLSSPLSLCASASSDTPGSQPSAGNSAPVDTRGENTKHLTKYLAPPKMWQEAKDGELVTQCDCSVWFRVADKCVLRHPAQQVKRTLFLLSNFTNRRKKTIIITSVQTNPPLTVG